MIFILVITTWLISAGPSVHSAETSSLMPWYDNWLKTHVSATGVVNYKAMKAGQPQLRELLREMGSQVPAANSSKNEQLAYWINLYNAATIDLVLQHYPVKSIKDISQGKPWDLEFITAGSKKCSLNYIEHEILRKQFSEPRIHFAINCAAKSCPKLLNGAFKADQLETQLNRLTAAFINDPAKNKITSRSVELSEIFNWYSMDFLQKGSVIDFLNAWSATKIDAAAGIRYLDYDWSLNDTP